MANPSRLDKIQITGNSNSGTATKVNVQEANGEVNTQTINTGFNKNFGLNSGDVVGANTLLNQYSTTPIDWTATTFDSGQVVFYAEKQWIAKMATVAGDVPAVSSKWEEITFEALANKTVIVDATPTDGSNNAVSSNGVFDALSTKAPISSVHNPVTLGTANGLSLSNQQLSLGLASSGVTGALSGTDWNTFNGKFNTPTGLTTNYLPKWNGGAFVNSGIFEDAAGLVSGNLNTPGTAIFKNQRLITQHAIYGFLDDSEINYSGVALQAHASFNDNSRITGVQNSDHHHSYQSYPHYNNTGTLTNMFGFFMQPDLQSGTVTNLANFRANNPLGAGVVNNLYGLYIPQLDKGMSQNYAIFTQGNTPSFFGGNTYFSSKVGIGGTITPTANLEVIDSNQTASEDGNVTIRTTDSQAADKGGFLTFGGSFSGTSRTVFGGISGRKTNSTVNDIQGYLSLYYSKNGVGLKEGVRLNSRGALLVDTTTDNLVDRVQVAGTISASPATTANQVPTWGQVQAAARPYKVYTALLNQSGTDAPTATVLENTLGGTVVWSRTGIGVYTATLNGAFILNKTCGFFSINNVGNPYVSYVNISSINSVTIQTVSTTGISFDLDLANASVEIRVYL